MIEPGRASYELHELGRRWEREIYPVLTPLGVGPGRPFPYISGLSVSLAVFVRDPESGEERFARVKVPEGLPRYLAVGTRVVGAAQVDGRPELVVHPVRQHLELHGPDSGQHRRGVVARTRQNLDHAFLLELR